MSIHPEFIAPIREMFRRLVAGDRDEVFVDYVREDPNITIQLIDEIIRSYPYNGPAYHFVDIPDEEFINNGRICTFLREDSDGRFGDMVEDQMSLRMDIDSIWEVEGIHPWTEEEGQAEDLYITVNIYVEAGGLITAKLVDIHE